VIGTISFAVQRIAHGKSGKEVTKALLGGHILPDFLWRKCLKRFPLCFV